MTNTIETKILKEFDDSFISSDEEQTHDSYPYNIKPFIHVEVKAFLESALRQVEMQTREEDIDLIRKYRATWESDSKWDIGIDKGLYVAQRVIEKAKLKENMSSEEKKC